MKAIVTLKDGQIDKATYTAGNYYVHGFKSTHRPGFTVIVGRKSPQMGRRSVGKWLSNDYFETVEEATKYFEEFKTKVDFLAKQETEKRSKKAQTRATCIALYKANTECPYKVGDLVHTHWGYDQTNVEAFEFVKILSRTTALIREIGGHQEATGWAQAKFTPVRGKYIGEPKKIHAGFSVGHDGTVYESWSEPKYKHALYPVKEGQGFHTSSYA